MAPDALAARSSNTSPALEGDVSLARLDLESRRPWRQASPLSSRRSCRRHRRPRRSPRSVHHAEAHQLFPGAAVPRSPRSLSPAARPVSTAPCLTGRRRGAGRRTMTWSSPARSGARAGRLNGVSISCPLFRARARSGRHAGCRCRRRLKRSTRRLEVRSTATGGSRCAMAVKPRFGVQPALKDQRRWQATEESWLASPKSIGKGGSMDGGPDDTSAASCETLEGAHRRSSKPSIRPVAGADPSLAHRRRTGE